MNKQRRDRLRAALASIESIASVLRGICDKEESCMENYPENLQTSEAYERMEDTVEHLNEAIDRLDEAKSSISAAIV